MAAFPGISYPRIALVAALSTINLACEDSRDITDPSGPDGVPPEIRFDYPASGLEWDEDGDGLIDIRLSWGDQAGVDAGTWTLSVVDPGTGRALEGSGELIQAWHIVEQTAHGLRLEETVAGRLPRGTWSLSATVADSSGTIGGAATGGLALPPLALHRTIVVAEGWGGLYGLSHCAPRDELYVIGNFVSVIDAQTFEVRERGLAFSDIVYTLTCSGDGPLVMATPDLRLFNVETLEWHESKAPADMGEAFAVRAEEGTGLFAVAAYFYPEGGPPGPIERRVFRFDAATGASLPMESVEESDTAFLREIGLVGDDLFLQGWPRGFWVMRDWMAEGTDLDAVDAATGWFVDLETAAESVLTLATSDDGSHVVRTSAATGFESASWWVEGVLLADLAVSPTGDVFAPAREPCGVTTGTCAAVPPVLLTAGSCADGCRYTVPLPDSVLGLQNTDQAAFRADGALLFWVTLVGSGQSPRRTVHVYLHRP